MSTSEELLHEWMPRQRWFGGKGRELAAVRIASTATLLTGDPRVDLHVVHVDYTDGGEEDYQVLLGTTDNPVEGRLEHAILGDVQGRLLYDAVHDPVASGALLQHLSAADEVDGIRFTRSQEIEAGLPGRVMGAEQSNTSLVFGDSLILKLFRRLQPGANPDIEITLALARAGSRHVAAPLAWIDGVVEDQVTTLGLLQPFLRNSAVGWAMATTSVRDLFAEEDLHADEVGGDFAGESERLGGATGEVHALMAQSLPSGTVGAHEIESTVGQLNERLGAALAVVPELAPFAEPLRTAYEQLRGRTAPVPVQRVHGDYHLGQVLRTQEGWVLLDFEGEPARPLSERRALMSPLRDVAGMLRSFDYAAHQLLADHPGQPHLAYRAVEWAERNRQAFCDGYAHTAGSDPRGDSVLLRALELDKAVYEVVYEARNRPSWLPIPLGAIARLVDAA